MDLATLVPPTVESVAYIRDVPSTTRKLSGSPFQRFYNDPRTADFFKPLRGALESRSRELARILGGRGDVAVETITGGLLVATLPPPSAKGEAGYLIIYERAGGKLADLPVPAAKPGVQVRRIPAKAGKFNFERVQSAREVLEEIKGGKKSSDRKKSRVAGGGSLPLAKRQVVTEEQRFVGEGLVIMAGGPGEPMRQALARLSAPGGATLATLDRHRGALAPLTSPPDVEFYADLYNLTRGGTKLLDGSLFGGEANLERLGISEFKSVSMGLTFLEDRMRADFTLYVPGPRVGMGKLLFMNEPLLAGAAGGGAEGRAESAALTILPPGALSYSAFGGDLGALWREFRLTLREGAPRLGGLFDVYFQSFEKNSAVNLEADLFGNLGSRWVAFTRSAPGAGRRAKPETTFVVRVKDAEKLRPALKRWLTELAGLLGFKLEEGAIGGQPCYRLVGAEASEGSLMAIEQFANVCLTKEWLFLSPRAEHIEAALAQSARPASALRDSKDFARATADLPPDRFFESYVAPEGYGAFFQSPMLRLATGLMGGAGGSIVNVEAAPPGEAWREGFGPAGGAARLTKDALTASFFMLYAEKKPHTGP